MANAKMMRKIRDILIMVTAGLMILVVVFQCLEIQKFELMDVIKTRIGALFSSSSQDAPAAPGNAASAAAQTSDGSHGTSGIRSAVDAKKSAEEEAGL